MQKRWNYSRLCKHVIVLTATFLSFILSSSILYASEFDHSYTEFTVLLKLWLKALTTSYKYALSASNV
ncbi:MAG: hypothetical protein ACI9LY_000109 [Arenicella sp.]|jgi:hypothetical protein